MTKNQPKQPKASSYTHSVWSGKAYDKPHTQAQLIAESMAILQRHPTISKCLVMPQVKSGFDCLLCGQHIVDFKPCGCGAR